MTGGVCPGVCLSSGGVCLERCLPGECLPVGGVCLLGVSAQGGVSVRGWEGMWQTPPAVDRQTDTCENITFVNFVCGRQKGI